MAPGKPTNVHAALAGAVDALVVLIPAVGNLLAAVAEAHPDLEPKLRPIDDDLMAAREHLSRALRGLPPEDRARLAPFFDRDV